MPGDVAIRNRLLHSFAIFRSGLLEVFIKQPRAGGPDVAPVARLAQLLRRSDCLREILIEIKMYDRRLRVREADVEMTLEDSQHALDGRIGRYRGRRGLRE